MYGVKATKNQSTRLNLLAAVLLTATAVFASPLYSQSSSKSAGAEGISLTIRYFDKTIYTPDSDIMIKLTISNDSGNPYRFRLADNRIYSVDFDVRSMTNVQPPRSQKFTTQINANQPAF